MEQAKCGPGSSPETGLQGQVPLADRRSGRSARGYSCNLQLVGKYQGQGSTWVSQSTGPCDYQAQTFGSSLRGPHPGVQVVDVSNPHSPHLAGTLTTPAFLSGTWETLKVNNRRHLLAGAFAGTGAGSGTAFFDLYDIRDCRHPKLLNSASGTQLSMPANLLGHEGQFSPDGRTFWLTGSAGGVISALDVADPRHPTLIYSGSLSQGNHGMSFSPDGNTLYLSTISPHGVSIYDVTTVQDRTLLTAPKLLTRYDWGDGTNAQMSEPVTWNGKQYLVVVDEAGTAAARILDIHDLHHIHSVSTLKLQIHLPEHAAERAADTQLTGYFGYEGHYCTADRPANPTALACGYFQSGIRVFDIRDPRHPREIAYYNPPAQQAKAAELTGSEHAQGIVGGEIGGKAMALTADWCSSPPRFVGRDQLWATCQDNGFLVLRFTHHVNPRP